MLHLSSNEEGVLMNQVIIYATALFCVWYALEI
jgi:hypothetical protein